LNAADPASSFEVVQKSGPLAANPFTHETTPIELRAKARRVPQWQADRLNVVGKLQESPVKTSEPLETVTLIPMGAARLRITSFPVVGHGPETHEWIAPVSPERTDSRTQRQQVVRQRESAGRRQSDLAAR
jgi:hypothetical protein